MRTWLNGRLLDTPDEAAVSVLDHGLTVGDGAFETIKAVGGEPFALTRHLARLGRSLRGLGLTPPDEAWLREGVAAVLDDAAGDLRVRITITGGVAPLGSERGNTGLTVAVASAPLGDWPPSTAIATVPWPRNERGALAGLKTTSYAENVVALARAHQAEASEAIFANTVGELCEGTGSNIFYVLGGEVVTPTLASGCLAGVTRALVLEWADCVERDAPIAVLADAEEIFLASTTRDVQGVHRCDGRELEAPGPVTSALMRTWSERAAADVDP
ncbi:MAG: aminotransferase class IV [Nocardioidaceae bacterium]|nr:aminotransferase class IV [Nocardioidaceae bacterium]MDQ3326440.1 aminotransferase class IV [Actinomycetota bacterium]